MDKNVNNSVWQKFLVTWPIHHQFLANSDIPEMRLHLSQQRKEHGSEFLKVLPVPYFSDVHLVVSS